ncbi:YjbH domain-containing protein [Echinicola sp. 20G]|uniref:YjbH domain-containing protein n=1 Tax=Echinicola sp. 20G TaxID=2781961 RepID=UPI001910BFF6|nr:YjbH domain-containing protein [Echinicola sp. 20G]
MLALRAQVNMLGKSGYMTTPSAVWNAERNLGFSFGYVPYAYAQTYVPKGGGISEVNTTNFYSVRAGIVEFLEVNFTLTYRPKIPDKVGVGDRHFDFRFHLFKERRLFPSVVLVLTAPGSSDPKLSQDYLVASKTFKSNYGDFSGSIGYGLPYYYGRKAGDYSENAPYRFRKKTEFGNHYLNGFFCGASYRPIDWGGVMVEYNTSTVNAGIFVEVKNWLSLNAYTFEGKELGFNVSMQFPLDFKPKELRQYEKTRKVDN